MADRLHTPLCDMLGIEYPIVLAGMAAGGQAQSTAPTPVKLVAAVTNAGGLGVMGDNFANLDELDAGIKELRSLVGDRPFGVDFLLRGHDGSEHVAPIRDHGGRELVAGGLQRQDLHWHRAQPTVPSA